MLFTCLTKERSPWPTVASKDFSHFFLTYCRSNDLIRGVDNENDERKIPFSNFFHSSQSESGCGCFTWLKCSPTLTGTEPWLISLITPVVMCYCMPICRCVHKWYACATEINNAWRQLLRCGAFGYWSSDTDFVLHTCFLLAHDEVNYCEDVQKTANFKQLLW